MNAVTVDIDGMKKELNFYNQTMTEIKQLEVQNGKLMFELEYISGEPHGGYYLANCTIGITNNKFDKPECKVIKREPS